MNRRAFLTSLGLGLGLGGIATSAYAQGIEPHRVRLTHYALTPPGWPVGQSLRIAMLADFHAHPSCMGEAEISEVVARTNALRPDVIALLGDYGSQSRGPIPPEVVARILKDLHAPQGVYAIQGNHDWTDDRDAWHRGAGPTRVERAFRAAGIPFLENAALPLPGARSVWIAGIESEVACNVVSYRPSGRRRDRGRQDRAGFLSGTILRAVPRDATVILLAHEPDIFADPLDPRVALTLSGHTHGGQIRILGWSPWIPSRYGNRYGYGHIVERDRHLVVSGGLGSHFVAGRPLRLGSPPEIVIVDVGPAQPAA